MRQTQEEDRSQGEEGGRVQGAVLSVHWAQGRDHRGGHQDHHLLRRRPVPQGARECRRLQGGRGQGPLHRGLCRQTRPPLGRQNRENQELHPGKVCMFISLTLLSSVMLTLTQLKPQLDG